MTKIYSCNEILEVPSLGYHCEAEKFYINQQLEHRRRAPKIWRRVSRVRSIKTFKKNHNEALEKNNLSEHCLTTEEIMAYGFCYNCGGPCPQNGAWFQVVDNE
jgi:hypothetical protein